MKKLILTFALLSSVSFSVFAQVNRTIIKTETTQEVNPVGKQAAPEGHYCDYCKMNYAESHFPCLMKAIKGKVNASGRVEFVAGQPIGGIVVKGGKNPGGNMYIITNDNGEIEFNNATAGSYKFTISVPATNPQDRQAGSPIGGIVVKGGKNPGGGNNIVVITNDRGEVELNNLEAGNYRFSVVGASQSDKNNPLYKSTYTQADNPLHKVN